MIKTVTTCGNRRVDLRLEIVGQGRQDPRQDSVDAKTQNELLSYKVDLALNRVQVLKIVFLLYMEKKRRIGQRIACGGVRCREIYCKGNFFAL